MAPLERALKNVREAVRLAPGSRPAYAAGLRAAVATVAPILADAALGLGGAVWMSLGSFNGSLSDRGGAYRNRATTLAVLAAAAALAAALGAPAGARLWVAVPLAFLVALACSLARGWGNIGAVVGGPVMVTFLISLALPPHGWAGALPRAGFVALGVAWAALLALVLWPLRPYAPLRRAVAECYRALAVYADDLATRAAGDEAAPLPPAAAVRTALEAAGAELGAARRGRAATSGRGERLVVLREIADQLLGHLAALADTVEALPPDGRAALAQTAAAIAAASRELADAMEATRDVPTVRTTWSGRAFRERVAGGGDDAARAHVAHAALLLDRIARYATSAAEVAAALEDDAPIAAARPVEDAGRARAEADEEEPEAPLLARITASVAPDSVVRRHALRVAIVAALAVWVGAAAGMAHGYWMTITAVLILQPYTGATTQRALQRVGGTVLGAMLTAGLGALFHDAGAILVMVFVLAGVSVALLPLNYAVFSIFLTPTFVLLAEMQTGDWTLAGERAVDTLLGAVLAIVGARLLWPAPEWSRLPTYAAAALRANAEYLRLAAALFGDRGEDAGRRLRDARRDAGLAALNADESFQRLLGEHRGSDEALEPVITLLAYGRRFTASVAALAISRHAEETGPSPALEAFARAAGEALEEIAAAVEAGRAPAPLPATLGEAALLAARLDRLARQVEALQDAAARWAAEGAGETARQPAPTASAA